MLLNLELIRAQKRHKKIDNQNNGSDSYDPVLNHFRSSARNATYMRQRKKNNSVSAIKRTSIPCSSPTPGPYYALCATGSAALKVNVNLVPFPGSLETPTSPP